MLHVERGENIDPGGENFFHVQIALRVAAARRIGMGQLVHQHQRRFAGENGVQVHFRQGAALIIARALGQDFEPGEHALSFRPPVGFHHTDDDIHPLAPPLPGDAQHLIGFTDAGRGPEENAQPPPPFFLGEGQQRLGVGALLGA